MIWFITMNKHHLVDKNYMTICHKPLLKLHDLTMTCIWHAFVNGEYWLTLQLSSDCKCHSSFIVELRLNASQQVVLKWHQQFHNFFKHICENMVKILQISKKSPIEPFFGLSAIIVLSHAKHNCCEEMKWKCYLKLFSFFFYLTK